MSAWHLLEKTTSQGIVLFVADGRIRSRGPKPDAAFLFELREHEAELVALLTQRTRGEGAVSAQDTTKIGQPEPNSAPNPEPPKQQIVPRLSRR